MKKFLIALQFLTIFPVKIKPIKEEEIGKSLIYFPIVGALIGGVLVSVLFVLDFLPNLVKCSLILIISIVISGGIHLEGFSDACDGLYGGRCKEEILDIMRDSHIGAIGVIGLVCILLLKFALFLSIPKEILWKSLILMALFSRWIQVLVCYTSKYARKEGKGKYFIEYADKKGFFMGSIFTLIMFLSLMKIEGIILFFISLLPIWIFINYVKKRIDGVTGDIIGATSEIAEVAILFFTLFFKYVHINPNYANKF